MSKDNNIQSLVLCLERLRKDIDDGKLSHVEEEQFYGINYHSSKLCEFLLYATNSSLQSRSIDKSVN